MFEKKEPFNWKPPVLILTGLLVLTGGIYLGVKSTDKEKVVESDKKIEQPVSDKKEVFELSKDCEIWVHKKNEDGSDSEKSPVMIGTIDKALLNKSEKEIRAYLEDKYPQREIQSLSKFEIVLSEVMEDEEFAEGPDTSRNGKYSLEQIDDYIGVYRYDNEGKKELIDKTEIRTDSLPNNAQNELKKGIIVNSEDEAYGKLEEFGS